MGGDAAPRGRPTTTGQDGRSSGIRGFAPLAISVPTGNAPLRAVINRNTWNRHRKSPLDYGSIAASTKTDNTEYPSMSGLRGRRLRIAELAPLAESVPPKLYGGTERVVSWLTEELVGMGHDVTLFASGDSETSARLLPVCEQAVWRDPECRETLPHHVHLVELVFSQADQFDVIHFHCDYVHFPFLRYHQTPTVTTLHGMLRTHDLESLFCANPDVPLVSISNDQRRPFPDANWQATIYHGLPRDLHTFRERSGDY